MRASSKRDLDNVTSLFLGTFGDLINGGPGAVRVPRRPAKMPPTCVDRISNALIQSVLLAADSSGVTIAATRDEFRRT